MYNNSTAGFAAGLGVGYLIFVLAICIFAIVCMWRVFEKAGESGWKCLIPIYNLYIYYKIAWEAKYFFISVLATIIAAFISGAGMGSNSSTMAGIGGFLLVVAYVALLVVSIISSVKLAKRFGKGGGFAVGLILLSIIFMGILAFDDSDYDRSRTEPSDVKSFTEGN